METYSDDFRRSDSASYLPFGNMFPMRREQSSNDGVNSSRIIEEFHRLISEPADVYENAVTRRYLAPVGYRGDCNRTEIYHRNNNR
ncbi:unnamed protein product [Callosobruchus maculatus]|uniref:Uncharacterized protein n=1 Tax=Callosobruchus maculatus TaxID=64391 RepID=A0A653DJ33_CALMS|nr:unnamed protein product [Callosobruchus maculatus]